MRRFLFSFFLFLQENAQILSLRSELQNVGVERESDMKDLESGAER